MFKAQRSIRYDAPLQTVWEIGTSLENWGLWTEQRRFGSVDRPVFSAPKGTAIVPGTRIEMRLKAARSVMIVREWESPRRVSLESDQEASGSPTPLRYAIHWSFSALSASQTRVDLSASAGLVGALDTLLSAIAWVIPVQRSWESAIDLIIERSQATVRAGGPR